MKVKTAVISSTSLDLPEHRRAAIKACQRMGFFPAAMEYLPASDTDAVSVSLGLVDTADVYIGIFAWRYGHVPSGHQTSITEMEFDQAVDRGIPILVFLIDESVEPAPPGTDSRLTALKVKASDGRVRATFTSPDQLQTEIIHALANHRLDETADRDRELAVPEFHADVPIPSPPDTYVAHPYVLLQTSDLVGRASELRGLNEWLTGAAAASRHATVNNVVAIGGMGKSALSWKWFQDEALSARPNLAGRMWWSFYESDAHFENFMIRACAYTTGLRESVVRSMTHAEREERLLQRLNAEPFLFVLDGLERILLAYTRLDAAHMLDDELDERTANPSSAGPSAVAVDRWDPTEPHRLRQCADRRAGDFLRKLLSVGPSKVLITSRLVPSDLEGDGSRLLPGAASLTLEGLADGDALSLWRAFVPGDEGGSSDQLLQLFRTFDNYPLLLRALAGEIANYRPSPGDFGRWRRDHPEFEPAHISLRNARTTHVLQYAMLGLSSSAEEALATVAASRMPVGWETLRALLVGPERTFAGIGDLDDQLTELEDRGLLGWDRSSNRYDLHPVVRSVVWAGTGPDTRRRIHQARLSHFANLPAMDWKQVSGVDDLTPAIELYVTMTELERYDDAYQIWRKDLDYATLWRLNLSRDRADLLALLFPDGPGALPRLTEPVDQSYALNALAAALEGMGRPGGALPLYRLATQIDRDQANSEGLCDDLSDVSMTNHLVGRLRDAESTALEALVVTRTMGDLVRECWIMAGLHIRLRTRGKIQEAVVALERAARLSASANDPDDRGYFDGMSSAQRATLAMLEGDPARAERLADRAFELAAVERLEADFIRAARIQGMAALAVGGPDGLSRADERLHHALLRARQVNLIPEELTVLTALADLELARGNLGGARELLQEVWLPAEVGPYLLHSADARVVAARIEIAAGDPDQAAKQATEAVRLAWCDGPPFSYHHALTQAEGLLRLLGAKPPEMERADRGQDSPMPDVELNPADEFGV